MNGNELLEKMDLIDPAYINAADPAPKKTNASWIKWGAAAACICLAVVAFMLIARSGASEDAPISGNSASIMKTTAKVTYGYEKDPDGPTKPSLVYYSEEEMFAKDEIAVFRGRVGDLTYVTVDFDIYKVYWTVAEISVDKVYKGDISEGDVIKMLIHCQVGVENPMWVEDNDTIVLLRSGMEGIFMPRVYDDDSKYETNGFVLMLRDVADYGIGDGTRWVFLSTDSGVRYAEWAYPGAKGAKTLDDIETYVTDMLKGK